MPHLQKFEIYDSNTIEFSTMLRIRLAIAAMLSLAGASSAADLFRDDFSRFLNGLAERARRINAVIQEYHYLRIVAETGPAGNTGYPVLGGERRHACAVHLRAGVLAYR